jgi:hypothetical protein
VNTDNAITGALARWDKLVAGAQDVTEREKPNPYEKDENVQLEFSDQLQRRIEDKHFVQK